MASFYNKEIKTRARISTYPSGGFCKDTYDTTVSQYWEAKNEKTRIEKEIDEKSNENAGTVEAFLQLGRNLNDAAGKYERCKDVLFSFKKFNSECPEMTYYPNGTTNDKGEELPKNYEDYAE